MDKTIDIKKTIDIDRTKKYIDTRSNVVNKFTINNNWPKCFSIIFTDVQK